MRIKCLSSEALKAIACIAMLLDHIGATIYPSTPLRIIGRLAFPIYCFALCQGFHHTKSRGKYLLRLGLCAVISELPFDLLFMRGFTWEYQNVLVTLFLGLFMVMLMEKTDKLPVKLLILVPFYLLAELLRTDYGGAGILTIALFMLTREMPRRLLWQTVGLAMIQLLLNSMRVHLFGIAVPVQLFAVFAMVPIALYSGRKATASRALQWGFYLFYPVHITVLFVICVIKFRVNLL